MSSAERPAWQTDGATVTPGRKSLVAISETASFWRALTAALATTALALLVAALVARAPPDFAERPVASVVRDSGGSPLWAIRLAPAAHQIAIDGLAPPPLPPGYIYQLWLVAPGKGAPRPLGLLPQSGRKVIAETPANSRSLSESSDIIVTLEPKGGSRQSGPSGPVLFHARLHNAGGSETGALHLKKRSVFKIF